MTWKTVAIAAAALAFSATGWTVALTDSSEPGPASVTVTTAEPTTTTARPTTTTRPAPTTTSLPPTTTSLPPITVAPPETWDSTWTCDLACTNDLLGGYSYESSPTTMYERPCTPSTFTSCDPDEPMDLPAFGCDYLERTFSGDVKCVSQ
jgi:hypothetical protein